MLECLFEAVVLMSVIVHFKVAITVWYTCRLQQKYILWMTSCAIRHEDRSVSGMRVGVGAGRGRQGMCSGMRWWSVEWQSVREQQCGACVILCMQLHANIDLGGQQQCPAHFLGDYQLQKVA